MDKRFVDALNGRFDQVMDDGAAVITTAELKRWWERQRVTPSIWQDLNERWGDRCDVPLSIGALEHGYLLVWGDEGFLAPLATWAEGKDS